MKPKEALAIKTAITTFFNQHTALKKTEANWDAIEKWLVAHSLEVTKTNLEAAFEALKDGLGLAPQPRTSRAAREQLWQIQYTKNDPSKWSDGRPAKFWLREDSDGDYKILNAVGELIPIFRYLDEGELTFDRLIFNACNLSAEQMEPYLAEMREFVRIVENELLKPKVEQPAPLPEPPPVTTEPAPTYGNLADGIQQTLDADSRAIRATRYQERQQQIAELQNAENPRLTAMRRIAEESQRQQEANFLSVTHRAGNTARPAYIPTHDPTNNETKEN